MIRKYFFPLIILFSSFALLEAQVSVEGTPPSFQYISKLKSTIPQEFINPPDVEKLKAEDADNTRINAPYRIAENLKVELNIAHSGIWDTLPSGEIIWRLKIYSPNALGMRLIYNDFYLPEGSQLFLYNNSGEFVIGAFTSQNNHPSGMFATEIIPGEYSILEYVASPGKELPRINISQVSYIYRGIDELIPEGTRTKASESCEVNVNCSPEGDNWKDVKRSVTKIILDKYLCSGTLLNNTARDFKNYLSTAFHCIDGVESTASTWIFYFNYERSACANNSSVVNYKTLVGAWIRAKTPINTGADGALLEIFGTIPTTYNAYWAGWDRTNNPVAGGVGIHHPAGDYKKISTCRSNWHNATWHGEGNTDGAAGGHWSLVFSQTANGHGVTEGGSSGSGIFGPDELYRGSLSGGLSDCENPNYDNLYGKLFYNWDKFNTDPAYKFQPWLDPVNSGETRINGMDKNTTSEIQVKWTSSKPVTFVDSVIQYKDETVAEGYTRTWYFEGGTPSTSNEKEPIVTYLNTGIYDVKLTYSKLMSVNSKLRTDYVYVQSRPVWMMQNTGFAQPGYGITGIEIVDSLVVWAWAVDLYDTQKHITAFTRTTNGGKNWKADTIKYAGIYGYGIGNLFPLNKDTAYASIFAPSSVGGGKIMRTIDGGKTWEHQTTALFSSPSGFPNLVHFFNKDQGVCIGDPNGGYFEVYTTESGGTTWSRVIPSKIPTPLTDEYGTTNFYDAKGDIIWFGTTKGRIFRSLDRGKNWSAYVTSLTKATDVQFRNTLVGFAIQKEAPFSMNKTTDGGVSWVPYTLPVNLLHGDVTYVPKTNSTWVSVLFNDPSGSSYSTDDGQTYTTIESGVPYTSVAFYDARIGWAGSYNIDSLTGGIYKWNQGNWILTSSPDVNSLPDGNKDFRIYPNPVAGILNIRSEKKLPVVGLVELFTLQGQKVWTQYTRFYLGTLLTKDLSNLTPGIYVLRISGENLNHTSKIIKK